MFKPYSLVFSSILKLMATLLRVNHVSHLLAIIVKPKHKKQFIIQTPLESWLPKYIKGIRTTANHQNQYHLIIHNLLYQLVSILPCKLFSMILISICPMESFNDTFCYTISILRIYISF